MIAEHKVQHFCYRRLEMLSMFLHNGEEGMSIKYD